MLPQLVIFFVYVIIISEAEIIFAEGTGYDECVRRKGEKVFG